MRKIFTKKKRQAAKTSSEADDGNPSRITTGTVGEHRDKVLSSARKYIYPLQHSKHRIVLVSFSLFLVSLVAFFVLSILSLYKFQNTSKFIYRVTQVVPFQIARSGSTFVAYENYLFELRRYEHYYITQQKLDFKTTGGQQQLAAFKKRAEDKAVNDALVKQLAAKNHVSVSDREVNDAIEQLRRQNRLGSTDKVLEDVLREFWDWSINDFKRSLKQTLLAQKVVTTLDKNTNSKAEAALAQLKAGKDFNELAKQVSEDAGSKGGGGDIGFVDKTNRDIPPQAIEALFNLKPGQYSNVINVGYGLEVVKSLEVNGDKVHGSVILFNFTDISSYTNELKDQQKVRLYLKL